MYAKLHRIAIRAAICLSALGGISVANAGYAWPADPAGFVRSGPWGHGFGYGLSANDQRFGKIVFQENGLKLPVNGRPVTMPVAYRFAQNAPRYAARAIFLHPGVRTAAGVMAWLGAAGLIWDVANNAWTAPSDVPPEWIESDGYSWQGSYGGELCKKVSSLDAIKCALSKQHNQPETKFNQCRIDVNGGSFVNGSCIYTPTGSRLGASANRQGGSCPAGWYVTPAGCLQNPPPKTVTQQEFEDLLAPKPMPETVPFELPKPTPLPVEPSPGPWVNPDPGSNPQHRPMFVPTGDPVPNPNYDPNAEPSPENQPWIQPGVRLNPSPAVNDPFRIDVKPVDRPKPNETPMPGPEPEVDPNENPNDKPKPDERPGLCDEYPDILACAKPELDTPEDEIPKASKDVSYSPDNLFGGGSCPANKTMSIGGQEITVWDWDASCGYIQNYMRPVILVLCAFAAFVIVSGGTRQ